MDESHFGKGAVPDFIFPWDVKWEDVAVARGSAPFDWVLGVDIEQQLAFLLNNPIFKLPVKDQDGSGSCGGQAWSQYSGVLEAFFDKTFEERSAKYIYSQTFVPPGGGSTGRDNTNICVNQGVARETLTPSYDNGQPPGEAFMTRPQDITPEAKTDAATARELTGGFVNANEIDSVAQAIRDNHGCVLGVRGSNNGTWLSQFPKPPSADDTSLHWGHWIYAGKAKMIDGKKFIGIINSWGLAAGDKGWQWLGEEYFTGDNLFNVWTMIFGQKPPTPPFHYVFNNNIKLGDRSADVTSLQQALTADGEFTVNVTGFYGDITRQSVLAFQQKYGIQNSGTNGSIVGPLTRAELNKLFGQ